MEPLVLRCRILAPYVPLRATSSKSVPSVDIVYITQRSVTKTEFRNHLILFKEAVATEPNDKFLQQPLINCFIPAGLNP